MSNPYESRAAEILEDILEGAIAWTDISGAPPNTHDFEVQRRNGTSVGVEVTIVTDADGRSFWAAINKTDWSAPSLRQSWLLVVDQGARIKTLRAQVEPLLSVLEQNQVHEFGRRGSSVGNASPAIQALKTLGVRSGTALNVIPPVIMHSTVGTGVTDPDIVSSAVEHVAGKADNRTKLGRANVSERHLFVWIENDAHQVAAAAEAMRDLGVNPQPVSLQSEVDVLWVARPKATTGHRISGEDLWRYDRSDGWKRIR